MIAEMYLDNLQDTKQCGLLHDNTREREFLFYWHGAHEMKA